MPLCATYNAAGQVLIVSPPPADMTTCALLIPTSADPVNPFALSAEGGAQVAFAILGAWAVGFAARVLIRTLSTNEGDSNEPA